MMILMKFYLNKIVWTIIFIFFFIFCTLLLRCYVFLRVARAGIKDFVSNPFYLYSEIKYAFAMHGSQFKFLNTSHNSRVLKTSHDI